jgi:hypothetical protein
MLSKNVLIYLFLTHLLGACSAGLTVRKVDPNDMNRSSSGIRYYLTKPYLIVTVKNGVGCIPRTEVEIRNLSDVEHIYEVNFSSGFLVKDEFSITLNKDNTLKNVGLEVDPKIDDALLSMAKIASLGSPQADAILKKATDELKLAKEAVTIRETLYKAIQQLKDSIDPEKAKAIAALVPLYVNEVKREEEAARKAECTTVTEKFATSVVYK